MTITPGKAAQAPTLRAAVLRDAFEAGRLLRVAGAHDGLSARLAAQAGFDAVWASGLEISAAYGVPDVSLLGLAEYLAGATTMHNAVSVPVVADCDTGFGGTLNAAYTTMRYETAGIAAVCIEDKVFPKRNSFVRSGHELLDVKEFCQKLAAATDARLFDETVVIARTESFVCGFGVEEALSRCHQYVDAGADAVLVHSKSVEAAEVISFMAEWHRRAPVVLVPTTYPAFSVTQAQEAGVAMVIYANQGIRATVRAVRATWASVLAEGNTAKVEPKIATVREIFDISGMDEWLDRDR